MALKIRDLNVTVMSLERLKPYARNSRTHTKKQIEQIAASIKEFGWTNPILVDDEETIIAGHGRFQAAKLLGLDEVPVIAVTDLSDAQRRAYIIADNKLAENAGWDKETLRLELGTLEFEASEFSINVTGFETAELDLLLNPEPEDQPPTPIDLPTGPLITQPGDLWMLGDHRLYCGNALERESYDALLDGQPADAMFTDPPYNVPVSGHVCGLGRIQHDEFAMASGEMSDEEFRAFLKQFFEQVNNALRPGATSFVCMDWRHIADLIEIGEAELGSLANLCVWNKMQGGMGSLYRSQHELIPVFRKSGGKPINNVELGKHGRNRTNVWDYKGVQARRDELRLHPTVKPADMIADAIQDVTNRGDVILDPFAGSGSTLLAAEQTGRRAACIELEPKYVDVAIRRLQAQTGTQALHAVWDQTFDQIEKEKELV